MCWKTKAGRKKCVKSTLDGYSWNSDTSDTVRISTKGLAKRTTFTWTSTGDSPERLASKTIATPKARSKL
ncbi:hypothetical protein [Solirubrobacter soli]|uniref:hypothetical protein n=1 Tax=Solirubrobacter soli TaxID=363832 RepID=UPI00040A13C8|nr:hypothetical protein [Solirubrobacter soli]